MAVSYKLRQGALNGIAPRDITFPVPEEGEVFRDAMNNRLMYLKGGQVYAAPDPSEYLSMEEKRALGGSPEAIRAKGTEKFLTESGIDYGGNIQSFLSGIRTQNVGDLQTAGLLKSVNQQLQFGQATPQDFASIYNAYKAGTFGLAQAPTETITGAGAQTFKQVPGYQEPVAGGVSGKSYINASGATVTPKTPQEEQNMITLGFKVSGADNVIPIKPTTGIGTSEEPRQKEIKEEAERQKAITKELTDKQTELDKLRKDNELKTERISAGLDPNTGLKVEKPAVPSYTNLYETLRSDQGLDAIESRMNDLNKTIADTEASLRQGLYDEEGRLAPMELIGTRQRELQRQGQETLDTYNRELNTLVNQYNTKTSLIETTMKLKQLDYETAKGEYDNEFNKQLKLLELSESVETEKEDEAQLVVDTAKANLNTITTMLSNSKLTWDKLDQMTQAKIRELELQAGLPGGITEIMYNNANPNKEILTHSYSNDKSQLIISYKDGTTEVFDTDIIPESGGRTTTGLSKTEDTKFWSEVDSGKNELQQGSTWGEVWNRIKLQFPEVSNETIDNALGGGMDTRKYIQDPNNPSANISNPDYGKSWGWAKTGAYKEFKAQSKISNISNESLVE